MPGGIYVGVAPASIALPAVADALRDANVDVYAQDVHWEERGAFTGQISVSMVRGLAAGTIVGHSEVRRDLGDTDARIAKKLARAVSGGLRPILCVGESAAEHAAGDATAVVARQVAADIAQAEHRGLERLVIAYEPVWAIGTGNPATGEHASAAARAIRTALKRAGLDAEAIPVLYGGSVSARSAAEFAKADGIDGALVGGASLDADEFAAVVRAFA
jgi:triosephosphate isomerase